MGARRVVAPRGARGGNGARDSLSEKSGGGGGSDGGFGDCEAAAWFKLGQNKKSIKIDVIERSIFLGSGSIKI